jgi:hypothetical protein
MKMTLWDRLPSEMHYVEMEASVYNCTGPFCVALIDKKSSIKFKVIVESSPCFWAFPSCHKIELGVPRGETIDDEQVSKAQQKHFRRSKRLRRWLVVLSALDREYRFGPHNGTSCQQRPREPCPSFDWRKSPRLSHQSPCTARARNRHRHFGILYVFRHSGQ